MNPLVALQEMGFDLRKPQRGKIMLKIGGIKVKHYSFYYRIGDGHIITRRGRVVHAEPSGIPGSFLFDTQVRSWAWVGARVVWLAEGYPYAIIRNIRYDDDGDPWFTLHFTEIDHKDVDVPLNEIEGPDMRNYLLKHGH